MEVVTLLKSVYRGIGQAGSPAIRYWRRVQEGQVEGEEAVGAAALLHAGDDGIVGFVLKAGRVGHVGETHFGGAMAGRVEG